MDKLAKQAHGVFTFVRLDLQHTSALWSFSMHLPGFRMSICGQASFAGVEQRTTHSLVASIEKLDRRSPTSSSMASSLKFHNVRHEFAVLLNLVQTTLPWRVRLDMSLRFITLLPKQHPLCL